MATFAQDLQKLFQKYNVKSAVDESVLIDPHQLAAQLDKYLRKVNILTDICRSKLDQIMDGTDADYFQTHQWKIYKDTINDLYRIYGIYGFIDGEFTGELPLAPMAVYIDFFVSKYRDLLSQGKNLVLSFEISDLHYLGNYRHNGLDLENLFGGNNVIILLEDLLHSSEYTIVKYIFLALYELIPEKMDIYAQKELEYLKVYGASRGKELLSMYENVESNKVKKGSDLFSTLFPLAN